MGGLAKADGLSLLSPPTLGIPACGCGVMFFSYENICTLDIYCLHAIILSSGVCHRLYSHICLSSNREERVSLLGVFPDSLPLPPSFMAFGTLGGFSPF